MRNAPLVLPIAALMSGCLPVMPHPTRVEPAFHIGMNVGFAIVSDSTGSRGRTTGGIPFVDTEFALGLRDPSRNDGPGLRLGTTAGMSGYAGALYTELPRPFLGEIDSGIGVFVHRGIYHDLGSYVQFGRSGSFESWYVRNAIVLSENHGVRRPVWMPTFGFVADRGTRMIQVYLAAVIGQQPPTCGTIGCSDVTYRQQTKFLVGASMSRIVNLPRYSDLPPRR